MKKKLLIGSLVVVVILLCIFYFVVLKNKKNKVVTEEVEVVPTMNDKIDSDSTWCGTFQLVWNDMINEVVRQDILFKDNNDMVTNLNKMDFNTSMISEEYYYKKYGFKTLSLKKEIEQGIKNKFNQTSDILDSFSWSQDELSNNDDRYFFYTMLYREFEYNNKFSVLKNDKFGNYDDVKYFGINKKSNDKVRKQIEVLFYNNKDNFAIFISFLTI